MVCRKTCIFYVIMFCFFNKLGACDAVISGDFNEFPEVGIQVATASSIGNTGHSMEDFSSASYISRQSIALCLCDGHFSPDFALYASSMLPHYVQESLAHPAEDISPEYLECVAPEVLADPLKKAMAQAFIKAHEEGLKSRYVEQCPVAEDESWLFKDYPGTTALMAVVDFGLPKKVTLAWAGDSAALLCRPGGKVSFLTPAHRALGAEADRIRKMGGVLYKDRVIRTIKGDLKGSLAMTRSLGDPSFIGVIPVPEITSISFDQESIDDRECLVLCSDGVIDGFRLGGFEKKIISAAEAARAISAKAREALVLTADPKSVAKAIIFEAYRGWCDNPQDDTGYYDDMTVQVCMPYDDKK